MDGAPFGVRRFGVGRLEFGVSLWAWQVDPHAQKHEVELFIEGRTPRISEGLLDRTRKLGGVILYHGRSTTNARVLCTGAVLLQSYTAETTSGRCYVTADVSIDRRTAQIFPSGERPGERVTQVL